MNPEPNNPNNTASSPTSPLKAVWIILLSIAVLGGFGGAGYMMLTGMNRTANDSDSTSPKNYLSNLTTAHQTASETLSELPRNGIEKYPETSTETHPKNSASDEMITTAIARRPTQKKTLKDYGEEFMKLFQAKTFRLDGIMTGKPPRVMINRQIIFVGGEIDGARVVQATPQQIILDYEGKEYTLKLGETIEP